MMKSVYTSSWLNGVNKEFYNSIIDYIVDLRSSYNNLMGGLAPDLTTYDEPERYMYNDKMELYLSMCDLLEIKPRQMRKSKGDKIYSRHSSRR